jgi:K+-sensing histidine kinase KdpD
MNTIEQIPQLPVSSPRGWNQYLIDSMLALGIPLVLTAIMSLLHLYPTIPNISIVYLLVIMALARTRGRFAAVVAAVIAFLSFDFFLVPPFYTLYIARWEEWLALGVFLVTALLTSQWTAAMRKSIEDARRREREAQILYEVGRVINIAEGLEDQLDCIALSFVRVFSSWGVRECAILLPDQHGTLSIQADAPIRLEQFTLSPDEMEAAQKVMAQGKIIERRSTPAADQSNADSSSQRLILRLIPLKAADKVLGVLCLRIEPSVSWFANEQRPQEELERPSDRSIFFWTFLDQAILVIERAKLRSLALSHNE